MNPPVPKNELLWVQYYDDNKELIAFITSNKLRTSYYLYQQTDGNWTKTDESETPVELETKVYPEEE